MAAARNPLTRVSVLVFVLALALSAGIRQLGSPKVSDVVGLAGIAASIVIAVVALIKGAPRVGASVQLAIAVAFVGVVAVPNYLRASEAARRSAICMHVAPRLRELSERTEALAADLAKSSSPTQARERLTQHVQYLEGWAKQLESSMAGAPPEPVARVRPLTDSAVALTAAYARVSAALETRDATFLDVAQRAADSAEKGLNSALGELRSYCGSGS